MRLQARHSVLLLALLVPSLSYAQSATEEPPEAETVIEIAEATETLDPLEPAVTPTGDDVGFAIAYGNIAPPPQGKGQIVFFREKKMAGAAISYKVRDAGNELGKLTNGSYFVHVTEPGTYAYTVHSETKDVLNLEVEAGETYYVVGSISMGILAGRPNLSPSEQTVFDGMYGKLKQAK